MRVFRAVRPRDAASLVVTRGEGGATRVLLGRRPADDRFMPNVFVFPGGRVDRDDARLAVQRGLGSEVVRRMRPHASPPRARALAVAAVREAWEETGLVFGERREGELFPDLSGLDYLGRAITPSRNPIRYHARFFRASVEEATGRIRSNGELLELDWYSIDEALTLEIIDVTAAMLEQVRAIVGGRRPRDLFVHYRGLQKLLDRD